MKKILGNIHLNLKSDIFKMILILFTITSLNASVSLKVDKLGFYKGDTVNITIEASGKDIEFTDIDSIGGYNIVGIANSSSTTIINTKIQNTRSKTYTIVPQKSFTIEPLKVIVDGKEEWTGKREIKLLKPSSSVKKGGDFIFELKADKTKLKVGESTTVKLIFKKRAEVKVDKLLVEGLKNNNFWIEKTGEDHYIDGAYEVYVYNYKLTPQKSGTFIIDPLKINLGFITQQQMGGFNDPFFDQFFQTMKYKKVFSNSLTIKVDPLPQNVEVFGDFELFATVDKTSTEANKPINLTIKILGEGNVEDIKKFSINLPKAVVYSDEPKVKTYVKDGKNYGEFSQKIAIISDKSYTIPPVEFKYFDKNQNKVVTKTTKPIEIKVNGGVKTTKEAKIEVAKPTKATVKKEVVIEKENSYIKYIYLIAGLILGGIMTYFATTFKTKPKEAKPMQKKIAKAKSDKELFELLLPYAKDTEIKEILDKLERNIYNGEKNKIDKEELYDYFT